MLSVVWDAQFSTAASTRPDAAFVLRPEGEPIKDAANSCQAQFKAGQRNVLIMAHSLTLSSTGGRGVDNSHV
jgi:hypothetical protein